MMGDGPLVYRKGEDERIVDSGQVLLRVMTTEMPVDRPPFEDWIADVLRTLPGRPLVHAAPNVRSRGGSCWRVEGSDPVIRLDGYGPCIRMTPDTARDAILLALRATRSDDATDAVIAQALHATASTSGAIGHRVGASTAVPWRPACLDVQSVASAGVPWWTGPGSDPTRPLVDPASRTRLDDEDARLLPMVVCAESACVDSSGRIGMLLHPMHRSHRPADALDAMGVMRAHVELAALLEASLTGPASPR